MAAVAPASRRFAVTYACAAFPCLLLFVWLVTAGHWDLFQFSNGSGFMDAQAHALLAGHLAMPKDVLGVEAFYGRHGHAFMYFGPFPALLRLPVAVFGHGLDGRLDAVSLLLAYAVAMAAAGWIVWFIRELVRPDAEFSRSELVAVAGLAILFGVGSSLFFDGAPREVYEEAAAWGLACSLVAYALMLSFMRAPKGRTVVWAGAFSTAAMLSRPSVGLGPVVALALLAAANAASRIAAARRGSAPAWLVDAGGGAVRAWWPMLTGAVAMPLALYMAINWAKFGTLVGVPFWHHESTRTSAVTQDVLRRNGGSLFGVKFIPTNLVSYLRPTGLRFDSVFPWVDFPGSAVPNGVRFATRKPVASISSAMPAWVLLSVGGAREIVRLAHRGTTPARLPLLLLGAFAATIPVFALASQAEHYTTDMFPILLFAGAAGAYALVRIADANGARPGRHSYAIAITAVIGVLSIATCWIMVGLALVDQRLYTAAHGPGEVAGLIKWQHDLPTIGGGQHKLMVGDGLPPLGRRGELFVVRDCRAMYVSTGLPLAAPKLSHTNWVVAERTMAAGDREFRIHISAAPPGTIQPLVDIGARANPARILMANASGGGEIFVARGPGTIPAESPVIQLDGATHTLEVDADQRMGLLTVYLDGRTVVGSYYGGGNGTVDPQLDSVAPDPAASGSVVPLPDKGAPVCRSILRN
jgi:hypothetical protein